jgi:hypothetical protein
MNSLKKLTHIAPLIEGCDVQDNNLAEDDVKRQSESEQSAISFERNAERDDHDDDDDFEFDGSDEDDLNKTWGVHPLLRHNSVVRPPA